jgi:hypothetical protein
MTEPRPDDDRSAALPAEDAARPDETRRMQIRMYGQGFGDCFLLTFPRVKIG